MKIEQLLIWYDPGIIVNSSDPFWSSGKMYLKLDGKFVQNCIWDPDIYFVSVDNIESYSPSPTAKVASPQHIFLNEFGIITSWLQVSKLTLSCGMEFTYYPFDKQVHACSILTNDSWKIKYATVVIMHKSLCEETFSDL